MGRYTMIMLISLMYIYMSDVRMRITHTYPTIDRGNMDVVAITLIPMMAYALVWMCAYGPSTTTRAYRAYRAYRTPRTPSYMEAMVDLAQQDPSMQGLNTLISKGEAMKQAIISRQ